MPVYTVHSISQNAHYINFTLYFLSKRAQRTTSENITYDNRPLLFLFSSFSRAQMQYMKRELPEWISIELQKTLLHPPDQNIHVTGKLADVAFLTEGLQVLCGLNMKVITPDCSMEDFTHLSTKPHVFAK